MGYTDFPLQLPQELIWLKAPKWHDASPPHSRLLCFHPGPGVFESLLKLVSFLPLPSLGLRLTSRSLQGCHSIAHLEHIYWELMNDYIPLWLGGPTTDRRLLLGHSFGCRIAFSFALRLDETGCTDVRVVLLDGRTLPTLSIHSPSTSHLLSAHLSPTVGPAGVADQPLFTPVQQEDVKDAPILEDALRYQHGQEAVDNMHILSRLPLDGESSPSMHAEHCGPWWHSHQLTPLALV